MSCSMTCSTWGRGKFLLVTLLAAVACASSDPLVVPPVGGTPVPSGGLSSGTGGAGPVSGGGNPTTGGTGMATGGAPASTGGTVGTGTARTAPGYTNLAPEMLAPLLEEQATVLEPPAPAEWNWFPIEGAICRDGSPAGIFVRYTDSDKLFVYVEGGGACSTKGFCHFNPANVDSAILGAGETVIGSALAAGPARQQPGVFELGGLPGGMFDFNNSQNPYKDWNGVYIPYCTGDVHFGTRRDAMVPGVAEPQQFVGYYNMQKIVGHIVPTFKDKVSRVMLHGTSAGSFGAALNYSMYQDAFGDIPVDVVLDSGLPFEDAYMPPCMQQGWRDLWGFEGSLPKDCAGCWNEDGGGLLGLADFLIEKHPQSKIAVISTMGDEVMRLFFSGGLNDCANVTTIDPLEVTLGQVLDPALVVSEADYRSAVLSLKDRYVDTGRMSTYLMSGTVNSFHQHVWRPRFYEAVSGSKTIAEFTQDFIDGNVQQIGP